MVKLVHISRIWILAAGVAVTGCGGGDPEASSSATSGDDVSLREQAFAAGGSGGGSTGPTTCVNPSRVSQVGGSNGSYQSWTRRIDCVGWTLHEFQFADLPADTSARRFTIILQVDLSHLSQANALERCTAHKLEYKLLRRLAFNGGSRWSIVEADRAQPIWEPGNCLSIRHIYFPSSSTTVVQEQLWVRSLPSDGNFGRLATTGYLELR